jgi:mRNA-degrading endonuclease RelE of RelBE toxin-antitoxin system
MSYSFVLHPRADKQLSKIPKDDDERIRNKIKEMVTNEWRELTDYDVKRVQGCSHSIYRTRIGGYRVFFVVEESIAAILHLDKREGAYGSTGKLEGRADDFFGSS